MDPGLWEYCKSNGTAGVLLIALVLFARWIGPRLDKLIDHFIAQNQRVGDVKPQLDRIEDGLPKICRTAGPANVGIPGGPEAPSRGNALHA